MQLFARGVCVYKRVFLLRTGHLRGDSDLGGRAVLPVRGDGADVDAVGGERRQLVDGVAAHRRLEQNGAARDHLHLGDALRVDELFARVKRNLPTEKPLCHTTCHIWLRSSRAHRDSRAKKHTDTKMDAGKNTACVNKSDNCGWG